MKKMFYIIPLLILNFCCLNAQQVPGYMGKRFTAAYYATMFPNFNYESYNEDYGEKNSISLNLRHNIEGEYVLTRNIGVGADFRFLKTGSPIEIQNFDDLDPDNYSMVSGWLNIKSSMAGVHATFFKWQKGFIAPLGGYTKLGLNYMVTNGEVGTTDQPPASSQYIRYTYEPIKSLVFIVGAGYQNIIFKRMTFNLGVECGINSKGWKPLVENSFEGGNINDQYNTPDGIQDGIDAINQRVTSMLILNMDAGLGFILF